MSANTIGQWFSFLESIKFNNKVKKKILYNYTSISHFCEVIKKSFGSHYDGNCDGNGSNLLEKHSQESRDANKHLQNSCDHHPALELQVRHNYLADTQFMQYCSWSLHKLASVSIPTRAVLLSSRCQWRWYSETRSDWAAALRIEKLTLEAHKWSEVWKYRLHSTSCIKQLAKILTTPQPLFPFFLDNFNRHSQQVINNL